MFEPNINVYTVSHPLPKNHQKQNSYPNVVPKSNEGIDEDI